MARAPHAPRQERGGIDDRRRVGDGGIHWRGRRHRSGKRGRTHRRQGNRLARTERRWRQGRQRRDGGLLGRDGFPAARYFGAARCLRAARRFWAAPPGQAGRLPEASLGSLAASLAGNLNADRAWVAGGAIGQSQRKVGIGIGMQADPQEGGVPGGGIAAAAALTAEACEAEGARWWRRARIDSASS